MYLLLFKSASSSLSCLDQFLTLSFICFSCSRDIKDIKQFEPWETLFVTLLDFGIRRNFLIQFLDSILVLLALLSVSRDVFFLFYFFSLFSFWFWFVIYLVSLRLVSVSKSLVSCIWGIWNKSWRLVYVSLASDSFCNLVLFLDI